MHAVTISSRHRASDAVRRLKPATTLRGLSVIALALMAFGSQALGVPTATVYRCKVGEATERLGAVPDPPTPDSLASLRQWDVFAVSSIGRGVKGETPLRDVLPLFETLLRSGPFAGTFADSARITDPFLPVRAQRFLDAAARSAARPPTSLLRELLGDNELVAELRRDASGAARRGADCVSARYLDVKRTPTGWVRFMPSLAITRTHLADRDLAQRCMAQIDRGSVGRDAADLLGRTLLWDLRLYLLGKPQQSDFHAALQLTDEDLRADFERIAQAMHLKYFLFGGREREPAAKLWDAFEAQRFIGERPDYAWVGHAAALAREIERGTLLRVSGERYPALSKAGATMPITYVVQPAEAATFATTYLVWPRSADKNYDGVRCITDTASELCPSPVQGAPSASGLRYTLVFTKPGKHRLTFQYKVYGIELPSVTHTVEVVAPGASLAGGRGEDGQESWTPQPVVIELTAPPHGYSPVYNSGLPSLPGQPLTINGGRKLLEFTDGRHAMEHLIVYEVRASDRDLFPAEITYCDPNPRGDESLRRRAMAEAEEIVGQPLKKHFKLAPGRARVVGRDCWVGRKGVGQDGKHYCVLCRGRQTYYKRSALYPYQKFWDALIGEQPIYDTSQIKTDTIAYAEAVLKALRVAGPGTAPRPSDTGHVSVEQASAYLREVREIMESDANLATRIDLVVAAWQQKRLENETAAKSVAEDIVAAYDTLTARAAALQPPDRALAALHENLTTTLGIGTAASSLIERGLRNGDAEKVTRGVGLLHGYDEERQKLRTQAVTLGLQYRH